MTSQAAKAEKGSGAHLISQHHAAPGTSDAELSPTADQPGRLGRLRAMDADRNAGAGRPGSGAAAGLAVRGGNDPLGSICGWRRRSSPRRQDQGTHRPRRARTGQGRGEDGKSRRHQPAPLQRRQGGQRTAGLPQLLGSGVGLSPAGPGLPELLLLGGRWQRLAGLDHPVLLGPARPSLHLLPGTLRAADHEPGRAAEGLVERQLARQLLHPDRQLRPAGRRPRRLRRDDGGRSGRRSLRSSAAGRGDHVDDAQRPLSAWLRQRWLVAQPASTAQGQL